MFIFIISNPHFTEKTVGLSGICTWIVEVEGEHADHHHHGPIDHGTLLFFLIMYNHMNGQAPIDQRLPCPQAPGSNPDCTIYSISYYLIIDVEISLII